MNIKIIASLATILVIGAAAVGGTFAYFSQTTTSTGNTFNTATKSMEINNQGVNVPTVGPALFADGLYPGAFAESAAQIHATGVSLKPELSLTNATDANGMADYLWLEVWTNGKLWYSDAIKNFPGYSTTNKLVLDAIPAGSTEYVAFRVIMLETAPETIQGGTYKVDVVITGHQWNDGSYPVSTPAFTSAGKYIANNWSYNVCGVRQPSAPAIGADGSDSGTYNAATYSPWFTYDIGGGTPYDWKTQAASTYQGGQTFAGGNCSVL